MNPIDNIQTRAKVLVSLTKLMLQTCPSQVNTLSMQNLEDTKRAIFEGQKVFKLTVGPLVFDVQNHPLYLTTPPSYVQQGQLRECLCECGQYVLYSEAALLAGRIRSCGCLKRKMLEDRCSQREDKDLKSSLRRDIKHLISQAQHRLKTIQAKPSSLRTKSLNQEESWLAERLRKLFALKGYANRKVVPLDTLSTKVRELKENYFVGQP